MPGCTQKLILGKPFLKVTQTVTKFYGRIKSRLARTLNRVNLHYLGNDWDLLQGNLNGHSTRALPDTGSDIMVVSMAYVLGLGLVVDNSKSEQLLFEFADGTTRWTNGIVRDIEWKANGHTSMFDLYILDSLQVDMILSKDYVFEMGVFSQDSPIHLLRYRSGD